MRTCWRLVFPLALAGCGMFGGGSAKKAEPVVLGDQLSAESVSLEDGYGINFPKTVAGFTRTDTDTHGHGTDYVAGYARTIDPSPIVATVRVHKLDAPSGLDLLGTGSGGVTANANHSRAALDRSIAQVHRFYPDAQVLDTGPAYIVRFGALQNGRAATLSYIDTINGTRQPITLRIETFCCVDARWDYEYRFRYPASLAGVDQPIASFINAIAWSADPSNSIDKPE